ncbi:hypothetical protein [Paenarthrobacter sp. PH39-S1]|uniref:hypothetical protein n=1 Tax=Paenarthrobacter sp. PH39-S1 TaxID=3046204 RepID=UPI0024B8C9B2|nr:hypothetical protein [Paenarthrobacter sp. PH39-S1]MDJ0356299.1 hypothetical protein [Paenarthrobacter sp. PH39-S1]
MHDDAAAALDGVEAVIEATGLFTTSRRVATRFFSSSTRAIAHAVRECQIDRHVLLSIINCERPDVQGYGYFAAKAEQERIARCVSEHLIIVRSTQWYEFAEQNLERFRLGPIALVPSMKIRPVALAAVAEVLADSALGAPPSSTVEVTGPDITTLWALTQQVRQHAHQHTPQPIPLPLPGRLGAAFRGGALLPADGVETVGPTLADWLDNRP